MTEPKAETEKARINAWYKELLGTTVRQMVDSGAVTGAAAEASPVWMAPTQVLIAKVWGAGQKSNFIWTISGPGVITDHIAGSMATNPRDVARHFALKWQLDADRLMELARKAGASAEAEAEIKAQSDKLIRSAEDLYALAARDQGWR